LKCQVESLYKELATIKHIRVKGYDGPYESRNLLRAELVPSPNSILQFVSINVNEDSLQSIDEQLLEVIHFILVKKMKGLSLVIFGWSDSWKQTHQMISKLENPPSLVISIRESKRAFKAKNLCDFLCALHANLHLGIELAIEAGATSAGIHQCRDDYLDISAPSVKLQSS